MSNFRLTAFALALGILSLGGAAAGEMNALSPQQAPAIDVSARAALPASAPSDSLNEKAVPDGSRSYPMTSVSGQHNMHSTAVVFQ